MKTPNFLKFIQRTIDQVIHETHGDIPEGRYRNYNSQSTYHSVGLTTPEMIEKFVAIVLNNFQPQKAMRTVAKHDGSDPIPYARMIGFIRICVGEMVPGDDAKFAVAGTRPMKPIRDTSREGRIKRLKAALESYDRGDGISDTDLKDLIRYLADMETMLEPLRDVIGKAAFKWIVIKLSDLRDLRFRRLRAGAK